MLQDEVLTFLNDKEYVSGARIATALGVSRAAVAKAVKVLRGEGCRIEAAPNRGYRLLAWPELLHAGAIKSLLAEHPWAGSVQVVGQTDSTNAALKRTSDSAPHGSVLIAERQSAGRGRMGRSFYSPSGAGVYLSALLRPSCEAQALMSLTAQTAVAVRRALRSACGVEADVKWVNDLLLGGKKICGILTELSVEAESGRVEYAVVGVGINCNQTAEDFPPELQAVAGSVFSQTGRRVDRNRLAAALIRELSQLPIGDWREEYRAACVTLGREVFVLQGSERRAATALDVGAQAELQVRWPDGSLGSVNSGEVSVRQKDS